jgi:hypothetical protein
MGPSFTPWTRLHSDCLRPSESSRYRRDLAPFWIRRLGTVPNSIVLDPKVGAMVKAARRRERERRLIVAVVIVAVALRPRWRRRRDDAFPINHPAAFARGRWYGPAQHHGRGASRSGASRRNRVDQPRFPTGRSRRMDPRRQLPLPSGLGRKAPRGYADCPQRRHPRHGWRLHTQRVLVRLAVSSKASSALSPCGKSRRLVGRPVRRSSASPQRAIRLGAQRGKSRACKRPPRSHPPRVGPQTREARG